VLISQTELKYLRSLQQKKFRDATRKFLLEGWRPLVDALHSDFCVEMIVVLPAKDRNPEQREILALAGKRNIPIKELKEKQLGQISDSVHSQGIVALVRQKAAVFDAGFLRTARFLVACDRVSDPGNLGTILRTCDWFGVDAVLLSAGCVSLYNDKVIRSTAGSVFHLSVFEDIDLAAGLGDLKSRGFALIGSALDRKPFQTYMFPAKTVLILGNEARGISPELTLRTDELLSIPRIGRAESLNVGIACGILLAHWRNLEGWRK
jgi:TrmH family RNA methyltransferase